MAVRNSLLGGTDWADGDNLTASDLNDTFDSALQENPFGVPVGTILPWLKTLGQRASGTNTSVSSNKLIDSGATFQTAGIREGMIVRNETDGTWTSVTSVDSETQLTLEDDIFTATGKTYQVYSTPKLPSGFVECNGQTISDSDSPYNGKQVPDLNGEARYIKGGTTSGTIGGSTTHSHTTSLSGDKNYAAGYDASNTPKVNQGTYTSSTESNEPPYYTVVWIIRIK